MAIFPILTGPSKWEIGWGLSTSQSSNPPVWRHRMHMGILLFIEVDIEHIPQVYRVSSILRGANAISKESSKDGICCFQTNRQRKLFVFANWKLSTRTSGSWWFYRYLALILRNVTQKFWFLLSNAHSRTPWKKDNFKGNSSSNHHFSVSNSLVFGGPVLYTLYFTFFFAAVSLSFTPTGPSQSLSFYPG